MARIVWLFCLAGCLVSTGCQRSTLMEQYRPPSLPVPPAYAEADRPGKELPPDKAARVCLGTAQELDRAGKYAEALKLYNRARATDPKLTPEVARRAAVLCDFVGDFTQAQAEYELALKHYPKDADLWSDYGYSWYCRGDWNTAEKHLRKALTLNPKHERSWINLGMTLSQQERYEESLQAFARVLSPGQAYCNVAFALLTQGKMDQARVYYRTALAQDATLKIPNAVLAKLDATSTRPTEQISDGGGTFSTFETDPQLTTPNPKSPTPIGSEN